ncbi:LacI family DNA-binding transcriptional regulator [Phyllobacterium lublinensis]|uniref:LacI family DNA-binding transcriptional regulator n=1 Tax=Phyllobacterium lublinensis TaxID=2875708 RepID=UPI001CCB82FA|nr:LacI family DNA-binding transcriptional regulator [Phyllobacterium sp. 2063]MBZ9656106.1 LacI family transcriptional regulator [Phyllobacterium sp. 2063]
MDTVKKPIKTMEEFSLFVGLSRPTVSKYFNDPNSVRKKTREIIDAAVKQSGFRPNIFAVNLNRRRTNILGLIVPNSTDPFYMSLTRRIEGIAEQAGYLAFVLSSDGKPELEERAIETFKSMNVAGAIIGPLGVQSHHDKLAKLGESIPLIYIDSPLDDTSPFVGTNNRQSFKLIVDYLTRSGDQPCYFGMTSVNSNAVERREAYAEAMRNLNFEPHFIAHEAHANWEFEKFGFETTARILREGGFPTRTVLCANDRIAYGVLAAAFQAGLKVGRGEGCDLRVAGHDDQPLSRYMCPPLTTVAQNYNEIGRLAIGLLFDKLGEDHNADIELPKDSRILLNAEIMLRMSA